MSKLQIFEEKMPKRKSDMKELVVVEKKTRAKSKRRVPRIRPEVKFRAIAANSLAPVQIDSSALYTAASVLSDLTVIAQGTDRINRIGRRINATALQIRGVCRMDAVGVGNTGQDYMRWRMVVVYDKDGGSAPTAVQVIENDTAAGATLQADFYGSRQMDQSERFKVLYDHYSPVCPTQYFAGAGNNDAVWPFDVYLKLANLPVHYSGVSATPITGNIHVFFMNDIQDKAPHASCISNITFTSRLHFLDL